MRRFIFYFIAFSMSMLLAFTKDTISIIGVGDIMLGTDYPSARYLPPGNSCTHQLAAICSELQDADLTFGNLEGTLAGGSGIPKKCKNTSQCYVFRMPQQFIGCIKECGFDILSTANNHSNDFGIRGKDETMRVLDEARIQHAGYQEKPYTVIIKDNVKYGFCAFSPFKGSADSKNYALVKKTVSMLDTTCDIVICSIHTGGEGADHQHLPKTDEIYLGYNRGNIYEFSHIAVDAGADVVFGHGPHVTRAIEVYKGRFIAYSLGNFSTYSRFNLDGVNGIAPMIKINVDKSGRFVDGKVIPVYQEGEGITKIDPQKRAIRILKKLTEADFPDSKLHIDNDGNITLKRK